MTPSQNAEIERQIQDLKQELMESEMLERVVKREMRQ